MNDRCQQLLTAAQSGDQCDFEALLNALADDPSVDLAALLEFAESPNWILRHAAVELGKHRNDGDLLAALFKLSNDSHASVRRALAIACQNEQWHVSISTVGELLRDSEASVRLEACKVAATYATHMRRLFYMLEKDENWTVRREAAVALARHDARDSWLALLQALGTDDDPDVMEASALTLEQHLSEPDISPSELLQPPAAVVREALRRAQLQPERKVERLLAWLERRSEVEVDLRQLTEFGTVLTEPPELKKLAPAHFADEAVESVLRVLRGTPSQAVVLLGNSGCGKTAIVHAIARRLASDGWHVLQVTPNSFLTGTVYLGEWQTRLTKLVEAIKRPRPVVLYLPNLEQLSTVGRSNSSGANVATALASYIERGEILVLGESTDDTFKRGLGADPALRKLFHAIRIKPAGEEATAAILAEVANDLGARATPAVLHRLCELADFSAVSAALPGRAVDLLRRVIAGLSDPGKFLSDADILATIRTSTGVPLELVDDSVQLDRAQVRQFFESRVMGQPEAIDAAVDLVTLIKAGLTDPNKPFGVLLFVGPTGVGKTELARALAEFCFGSPNRLTRLDMSEFASYEAFERLIGSVVRPGYLTALVNEQPFSILLFDEIEKGHINIYDLCLQIFDAGRLTDGQGRTADFRRTIIVLTSNVGAGVAQEEPIGFGTVRPVDPNSSQASRDLRRAFRPEFLNRLDRIVQFQPLSEETAEKIARREVARVLERSGIKRRNLVIDSDPSLMPLLLREGYSRIYGARPLKRAIERLVLLPLARAIAAGEVGANSLVRLLVRNGKVTVHIPQTEEAETSEAAPSAPALAADVRSRLAQLQARVALFREQVSDLSATKGALLAQSAAPEFWDDPRGAQQTFEQIYVFDGVIAQVESLSKAVRQFAETVERSAGRQPASRYVRRLDEFEAQAGHVQVLLACNDPRLLGDAIVSVTLIAGAEGTLNAVERIATMYLRLSRRHGFTVEVLDDHRIESLAQDSISLLVSGVGAYALLCNEAGLHALTYGSNRESRHERTQREIVRVDVAICEADQATTLRSDVRAEVRPLPRTSGRLVRRPRFDVELLHRPTMVSLRAWADGDEATVVNRLLPLLAARIASAADGASHPSGGTIVRRYRIGPTQLVRDGRTGRRTGRLELIFNGHLDAFLVPLSTHEACE